MTAPDIFDQKTIATIAFLLTFFGVIWAIYTYYYPFRRRQKILVQLLRGNKPLSSLYVVGPTGGTLMPDDHGIVTIPAEWAPSLISVHDEKKTQLLRFRVSSDKTDIQVVNVP